MALYYYAKDNAHCDKIRKNLFIHVNTVSKNLKDVLSEYTNNVIYNTFKLNTT